MPSVGHYANMSKHPKSVKLAILEFVEDRLIQVTNELGGRLVGVYTPINSEWDMLVILEVDDWEQYMTIYGAYFDTDNYKRTPKQNKKLKEFPYDATEGVFSASSSKTVVYYTAKHLREHVFKKLPDQP